jgi:hypothetical protein
LRPSTTSSAQSWNSSLCDSENEEKSLLNPNPDSLNCRPLKAAMSYVGGERVLVDRRVRALEGELNLFSGEVDAERRIGIVSAPRWVELGDWIEWMAQWAWLSQFCAGCWNRGSVNGNTVAHSMRTYLRYARESSELRSEPWQCCRNSWKFVVSCE